MHAGWVRPSTPFNVSKQWILPFGIILFPMATQLDPNDKEPKPGLFLFNVTCLLRVSRDVCILLPTVRSARWTGQASTPDGPRVGSIQEVEILKLKYNTCIARWTDGRVRCGQKVLVHPARTAL